MLGVSLKPLAHRWPAVCGLYCAFTILAMVLVMLTVGAVRRHVGVAFPTPSRYVRRGPGRRCTELREEEATRRSLKLVVGGTALIGAYPRWVRPFAPRKPTGRAS